MKNKIATLPSMGIMLLLLSACSQSTAENGKQPKEAAKPEAYPTIPIQYMNPEYEISVPGELKPYEQVAIYAKVAGFVKHLHVDRGDHVRKGQLLAVLEAPEMNQQFLSDKATEQKINSDYVYATQAYERLVQAAKTTGAVADLELDRAKNTMEHAKSAYQSSKAGTAHSAQLQQYLRIRAPFDGVITARNASAGALAGPSSGVPLFMIAQGSKLRLTLSLPEKHAGSVKKGMHATFTVGAQPGKTFDATLSRTSGLLDQQDRSLTMEFDIDNPSGELQGGDYAQVTLKLQRKTPSYWVPAKSVLHAQSGTFVMTKTDNTIKRMPVKEGIRIDTLTEVFGNLNPKDNILLKPSEEIKETK